MFYPLFYTSRLHVVFPQTLLHTLDLVDRGSVTKVVSASRRELFQVGNIYIYIYIYVLHLITKK